MTVILEQPTRPTQRSFAGGIGGLGEIWNAQRESLLLVENANAAHEALTRAYDERISELHGATGIKLNNPVLTAYEDFRRQREAYTANLISGNPQPDPEDFAAVLERRADEFDTGLAEAVSRIPDRMVAARMMRSVEGEAANMARAADERLGRLFASRGGIAKWAAMLGGGATGALADPITLMSLAAGGGPGAARTVAGRILATAGREAVINAGTEAAIQPAVQEWRGRLGLPAGFDEALRNVAFAGAFGGVFGAGGQGIAEGLARNVGRTQAAQVFREMAAREDLPAPVRAIAAGDGLAARQSLAEIRPAMTAEARGAIDAGEKLAHADAQRPAATEAARHDLNVAAADRLIAGRDAEAWPGFAPDALQVERVARAIAGETVTQADAETRVLARFLAKRGGIQDQSGELRQIGATEVFRGRLVRRNGETLDMAREAAAEAGFFDHLYGTPAEAVAKSTVNDLIDTLDAELRGATRPSAGSGVPAGAEAQLAGLEAKVFDIARIAGPAMPDSVLEAAARLSLDDGLEPGDALERVLVRAELDGDRRAGAAPGTRADPLPGWSDEDLAEASANRGPPPEAAENPLEPGKPDPEFLQAIELERLAPEDAVQQSAEKGETVFSFSRGGVPLGNVAVKAEGTDLRITRMWTNDNVSAAAFNTIGPRAVRQMIRQAREFFPDAERIVGERVGGARFGGRFNPTSGEGVETSIRLPARDVIDELGDADPAMIVPWDDGDRSVADISDAIRHRQGMAALVEACRV
ncbi:hypothetical protein [Mesorhizobium sp. Z1-4]|uniref:hypothetical protein n=1 Tax=Mesorhizobium sp. Z1-4 TaxID=2448478 RepID=UPI000FDAFCCA|nr:hypothetical protein [Mesorhizobium sp. Z1-4]